MREGCCQGQLRAGTCLGAVFLALLLTACPPQIGDDCNSASDCSTSGDRLCDTTQPGGYCTVINCEAATCPSESSCVEFRFDPERLAERYCMRHCGGDGDCRQGDGYACVLGSEVLDQDGDGIARVIEEDGEETRFCAAVNADE